MNQKTFHIDNMIVTNSGTRMKSTHSELSSRVNLRAHTQRRSANESTNHVDTRYVNVPTCSRDMRHHTLGDGTMLATLLERLVA